jgi:predicted transcriptional regulator
MIAEIESLLSMIQSNRLRTSSRGYYQSIDSSELRESRKEQELKLQLEATVSNLTVSTQRLEW